ncbi:DUF2522 domain-containing protein [Thomasclavelia sp.]|uniref:DUF2522 domain-containing protein n=1 Tax=Thomasclavelia sp. TaxID=3025757 RepID=UPI0025CE6A7E|nr:DUF2522 domain-containing protein [Thomasclavelia sp.]
MNTYKIYKLNPNVNDLLKQYPQIKEKIIELEPKNSFFSKQLECFFTSNDGVSDYIEYKLKDRYDYHRNKNIHYLDNQLTKKRLTCTVNDYYIIIEADKKSNIFLEILYQISKSYVIMIEQSKNVEV